MLTIFTISEVPDFSSVSMNRNLGITVPTQNQKISWRLELFEGNEELCFMYRSGFYCIFY